MPTTWTARGTGCRWLSPTAPRSRKSSTASTACWRATAASAPTAAPSNCRAKTISDEIQQDRIYGFILSGIFLGVAAFIINIALSRLVATQRDQIAVMKAFGYRNATVGWHYLKLALTAVLGGALVGIPLAAWLGSGLADIYRDFFYLPQLHWTLSGEALLLSLGTSIAAAAVGAGAAVARAVRLPPAEAMRPEPPGALPPHRHRAPGFPALAVHGRAHDRAQPRAAAVEGAAVGAGHQPCRRHPGGGPLRHRCARLHHGSAVPRRPARGRDDRIRQPAVGAGALRRGAPARRQPGGAVPLRPGENGARVIAKGAAASPACRPTATCAPWWASTTGASTCRPRASCSPPSWPNRSASSPATR